MENQKEPQKEIISSDSSVTNNPSIIQNVETPTVLSNTTNVAGSNISPPNSKKRVYIISLVVIIFVLIITSGYLIYSHSKHNNKNTKSNSQISADVYTEQDLNKITASVLNYGNKNNTLPDTIQGLNVSGLHYSISKYSYNPNPADQTNEGYIGQGNGAASKFTGFNVCATFTKVGLNIINAHSYQKMNSQGLDPGMFAYHRQGNQCYVYNFGAYGVGGPGLTPVLTDSETSTELNQSEGNNYPVDNTVNYPGLITSSQSLFNSLTQSMGTSTANKEYNLCSNATANNDLIRYRCTVEITNAYNVSSNSSTEEAVLTQLENKANSLGFTPNNVEQPTTLSTGAIEAGYKGSSTSCTFGIGYNGYTPESGFTSSIGFDLVCGKNISTYTTSLPSGYTIAQ